ncbi:MAG: hypothetical protein M3Y71_09655 [Actinomycetota bacterium]|nr:hypothetical protein [Actinomycetota bacterium]
MSNTSMPTAPSTAMTSKERAPAAKNVCLVRTYTHAVTTTTRFDSVRLNDDLDRFHLVTRVNRWPGLGSAAAQLRQRMVDERWRACSHSRARGEGHPAIIDSIWPNQGASS